MSADTIARGLARQTASRIASTSPGEGSALVGFRHSSANALPRTAQDKLREVVSVFDFLSEAQRGSVIARNGAQDVTAALQAAITATLTVNGGALYFPNGLYKISSKLVIPFSTGWRIFGESRGGTIIEQATSNTRILSLEGDLTHSWEISELGFRWGSNQPAANTNAVAIFLGTGTATGNGFFNWQVRRCTFYNGFRAVASDSSNSPAVWGCKVSECVLQGTMSGALFRAVPSPAVGQPNITIHNNTVDATSLAEAGIIISSGDNVELSRNEFMTGSATSNSSKLIEVSSTPRLSLIGNKSEFYNCGTFSPAIFDCPNSIVLAMGNSFNGFFGTGFPRLIRAATNGKLTIVGHYATSGMTAGNAIVYQASSFGLVADVRMDGPFITDNLRGIVGSGEALPRFDADKRQPDWIADNGDAAVALTAASDRIQYFNATLTANRVVTLPNSGLYEGMEFEIVRRAATPGAFTLSVTDPLSGVNHVIPASTNGYVRYRARGSAWRILAAGTF